MEISSQRLIIRTMIDADIDGFYEIFSRDEIDRFVHKLTRERVERFFLNKQKNPNPYDFAVFLKDSGKMIGNLVVKVNKDNNFAEISYVFHPDFWNNGYCTEACKVVLDFCFNELNLHRVEADCFEDNLASDKILREKLGMNLEGIAKGYAFNDHINQVSDFKFFGITKDEYLKLK